MRSKEFAHDYRYFPDPDLLPVRVQASWLAEIQREMPELPEARRERFVSAYALSAYDAAVLTATRALADYFEAVVKAGAPAKTAANWISTELLRRLNDSGREIDASPVSPAALADLLRRVEAGSITGASGKKVFAAMFESGKSAEAIIAAEGLSQIQDTGEIERHLPRSHREKSRQCRQISRRQRRRIQVFCGPGHARLARPGQSATGERNAQAAARLAGGANKMSDKEDAERRRPGPGLPLEGRRRPGDRAFRPARQARGAYFYPKANTPGCTTEGSEFRDAKPQFDKASAVILGCSADPRRVAGEIQGQVQIQFSAAERSGIRGHRSLRRAADEEFLGKSFLGIVRSTFLIGPDGRIAKIWDKVRAKGHAAEVLEAVNQLASDKAAMQPKFFKASNESRRRRRRSRNSQTR